MSPECLNCGSHVTRDYARVFTPTGVDNPRVCPHCPDMIRGNDGEPRQVRSSRGRAADSSGVDDADQAIATDGGETDGE